MCDAVLVDGERIENLGKLAKRLGTPMRLHSSVDWQVEDDPEGNSCLCCCDVPRMASEAGYTCNESDDVWIAYELSSAQKAETSDGPRNSGPSV
jgi:hypothetical protein